MFSAMLEEKFLKFDELISFSQLMLRWPQESFKKIFKMVSSSSLYEDKNVYRRNLSVLQVTHILKDGNNDLILVAVESNHHSLQSKLFINALPQLFCLKSEVELIEKHYPSYKLVEVGIENKNDLLICNKSNLAQVASLTFKYFLNWDEASKKIARPLLEYRDHTPLAITTVENDFDIDNAQNISDDLLWPLLPIPKHYTPPKKTLKIVDTSKHMNLIDNLRKLGQNIDYILAWHLDVFYPGLTDEQLGSLLPAKNSSIKNIVNEDLELKQNIKRDKERKIWRDRKRGQILRKDAEKIFSLFI